MSEEMRKKLSLINIGRIASKETKEKLRISHLGNRLTEESKRKISKKNKGRKTAEITKKRTSEVCSREFDIILPSGEIVHVVGLKRFCKENGYTYSKMSQLINGKIEVYRGIRLDPNCIINSIRGGCHHKYGSRKYFREGSGIKYTKTCRICGITKIGISTVEKNVKSCTGE